MLISQIDGREYYFIKSQYLLVLASQGLIPVLTAKAALVCGRKWLCRLMPLPSALEMEPLEF